MTITLSLPLLIGLGLSLLLFVAVTVLALRQGLFDGGGGGYVDMSGLFLLIFYIFLWLVPSLVGWAIYATWFKGGAA